MKSWYWFIACGAFAALAIGSYLLVFPLGGKPTQGGAEKEITVRLVQVRRVALPRRFKVSGELRPGGVFDIVSRLSGKVAEVRFKVGDIVSAGALVAKVQASGLEQRISAQEASVRVAGQDVQLRETELAEADKRATDQRELLRRELISRRDLEQAEIVATTSRAQAELAWASLAQQEAMLVQLRALRELTRLVAPVSGLVSQVFVKPGSMVRDQGRIMTLVDLDKLKLIGEIASDDAKGLRSGMIAQVSSPEQPGVIATGKVIGIESLPGGTTRSYRIEIALANVQRVFRPGMAAEASIDLDDEKELLLIPRSALYLENGQWVYKFRDGRAVRQEIMLGYEQGDEIEVTKGLTDGDSVIVDYPKNLAPDARVRAGSG